MYVQFYITDNKGVQKEAGTATINRKGRTAFANVPEMIVQELLEHGVEQDSGTLFPEDGDDFLKALPSQFSGSRFRAEIIDD